MLSLVGNTGKSVFDRVDPAVQAALPLFRPGSRLVNSIDHTSRVDISYTRSLFGLEGFGDVSYAHTGDRLQSAGISAPAYGVVNATLGIRKGHYELALVGDNLGDERGPIFIGTTGPNSGQGLTPRTVSLRFRSNFQ